MRRNVEGEFICTFVCALSASGGIELICEREREREREREINYTCTTGIRNKDTVCGYIL